MSNETILKIKIDEPAKKNAENILKQSGLTMTMAINMLIQEINNHGKIPFNSSIHNSKNNTSLPINPTDIITYLTCS
ncbi:type II toxin-antitoxin system RelB/DinJ family antitoxin [Pectinatus brassicae]|uniref:Addiction module RelB/DinJ family antitoxin n=1 Tax=Pectinatus brassicae TaxID=862415 RepID=A0A840UMR3_9FIRM|nr:type II toxin-antitoxin system RelB/DinJ family antitoxin [Pectinatus brassicae]MBB5335978.1 addiction module RelB/DinJ family antitoxin [Pectinatus brassicae]